MVLIQDSTKKARIKSEAYLDYYKNYADGTVRNDDYKRFFVENKPIWLTGEEPPYSTSEDAADKKVTSKKKKKEDSNSSNSETPSSVELSENEFNFKQANQG